MSQQSGDPLPTPPDEDAGEALPLIELDTLLARQPSQRKRLAQIGLALAACVVVLVTFWGIIAPRPPTPTQQVHLTFTTTKPPTVSILSNTNYGSLTINGQRQPGALPLTITMRGQPPYDITLNAPPFQPLTCQFPPVKTIAPYIFNPCNTGQTVLLDGQESNRLEMLFSLADLPSAQQQQIMALIANELTAQQTISVPAGSAIVTSLNQDGTLATTRLAEPLRASISLVPSAQTTQRGVFCFSFTCVGSGGFSAAANAGGQLWGVLTPVALRLRFSTASGQVVSDVTFPANPPLLNLLLAYDAATGWRIASQLTEADKLSQQLAQLVCSTGVQILSAEQVRSLSGEGWAVAIVHNQGIAGCELALTLNHNDQGHFVWRFGALLAADASAHSAFPTLPIASSADLAAVAG